MLLRGRPLDAGGLPLSDLLSIGSPFGCVYQNPPILHPKMDYGGIFAKMQRINRKIARMCYFFLQFVATYVMLEYNVPNVVAFG